MNEQYKPQFVASGGRALLDDLKHGESEELAQEAERLTENVFDM